MSNTPRRKTLADELATLKKRLYTLERATGLRSASIGEGGLTIKDGGSIRVEEGGEIVVVGEDGDTRAGIGFLGAGQAYGIIAYDPSGRRVMFAGDPAGSGNLAAFTVWDENLVPQIRLDPEGVGLAAPRIPYAVYQWRDADGNANWPSTLETTNQLLWSGRFVPHNPVIEWSLISRLSSTATSMAMQVEIEYPVGNVIRTASQSFDGSSQTWTDSRNISSDIEGDVGPVGVFNVYARRTGGSGTVGATLLGVYGKGT